MSDFKKGDKVRHKVSEEELVFDRYVTHAGQTVAICEYPTGETVDHDPASLALVANANPDVLQRLADLEATVARLEHFSRRPQVVTED